VKIPNDDGTTMKALITGVTGFVGSYLAEHLLEAGEEVFGLARTSQWIDGAEHLADRVHLLAGDIRARSVIEETLREFRPDAIYHLAAQASVGQSFEDLVGTWSTNFDASRNLFESAVQIVPEAKILYLSTGSVYGQPIAESLPITEESPLQPQSPYAMSKAAADLLASYYVHARGARIVIARPFNQIGPRQQRGFAIPDFACQIAALELQSQPRQLLVGDLSTMRDFTDVRDAVAAYHSLIAYAEPGEIYNVASGLSCSMEQILDQLLAISHASVEIIKDPKRCRRSEPAEVRVDPVRIQTRLGWKATRDLASTLRETLDYWREWQKKSSSGSTGGPLPEK
jgi:GDP-4-dehydro-6-deoxy-D-mannose reductase